MWGRKDFNLKDNSRREKVIKLVLHCLWRFAQVPLESKFLRCSVRITRQKSLKRVQSLTLHRGKPHSDGYWNHPGWLWWGAGKRMWISALSTPVFQIVPSWERLLSLGKFVNQMEFHILKNEYFYKMLFFSSLEIAEAAKVVFWAAFTAFFYSSKCKKCCCFKRGSCSVWPLETNLAILETGEFPKFHQQLLVSIALDELLMKFCFLTAAPCCGCSSVPLHCTLSLYQ